MSYTVYKISRPTNTNDNRQYIGITSKTVEERFKKHKNNSQRANLKLFYWLSKYKDHIIEVIQSGLSKEEALRLEMSLVPKTQIEREEKNYLNLVSGGGMPKQWIELSEEERNNRRLKIGNKHRGKIMSLESRKKMSNSHKKMKLSEQQKEKISKSLKCSNKKRLLHFDIISPTGERYTGKNLKLFCEQHGLERANMNAVIQGKRKSHKGWKKIGD